MAWHLRASHGLRLRLLWVLVPVLTALLVLDSWRDSVSLGRELAQAYDQSLLEPAQALSDSLGWDGEGQLSLDGPLHIISMFEAVSSRRKFLRVQLQTPDGAQSRLLLGAAQFPEPAHDPADAGRPFARQLTVRACFMPLRWSTSRCACWPCCACCMTGRARNGGC